MEFFKRSAGVQRRRLALIFARPDDRGHGSFDCLLKLEEVGGRHTVIVN